VLDATREFQDIVLVAHSFGGLTIPLVAAVRPVRALVFVCALVPVPGISLSELSEQEPEMFAPGFGEALLSDEEGRSYWGSDRAAIAALYPDCPEDLAHAAAARLRHQAPRPGREAYPLERWPDVPSISVLAREDSAVRPDWSRRVARERLGCEPIELPGGHSPFLSRPSELADSLVDAFVEAPSAATD
jgi:pimeloyl-ACP methyl ester carboxylesterase